MPNLGRFHAILALPLLVAAPCAAQGPATSKGTAVVEGSQPVARGHSWFSWLHREKHAHAPVLAPCVCEVCVPVPTTKKSTRYEYQVKEVTKCYPKARCDLWSRLHHEPPGPREIVAVPRRVLMKRAVPEEKPDVAYEPRKVAGACVTHHREHCPSCSGR